MSDPNSPDHLAQDTPALVVSTGAYNFLKLLAQVILPGVATLYFAVAGIWGLPAAEQVVGTITAADTFLGLLVGKMSSAYHASDASNDGSLDIVDSPEKTTMALNLAKNPEALTTQSKVVLKVNQLATEVVPDGPQD